MIALAALLVAAGSAQAAAREWDGRCALFRDGKAVFDAKCHISFGPEGAAGKVWTYQLAPPSGESIVIRTWTNAATVDGVPAMQVNSLEDTPFRYLTAEGDDLRFVRPPKGRGSM